MMSTGPAGRHSEPRLAPEVVEVVALRLQVLGEPTRMRLMELLNAGEATVQELTSELPTTHQNVSKHLRALYQAGIVQRRQDGNRVRYSLIDWTGWWLVQQVSQSVSAHLEDLQRAFRPPSDAD